MIKNWKILESSVRNAKTEKEKKKACFVIIKFLEKASISEIKEIIETTKDGFVRRRAELQLWWQEFNKKPEKLLEFIQRSEDKEKIEYAVTELGDLKYGAAVSTLIDFLDDINLRDSVAFALRQMPTQEAFEPIVKSIKQHPDGAECLLYALQVIDCSDAAELLVDLFISAPNAPVVRDDIYVCFAKKAVKHIPRQVKNLCCSKLQKAIGKSTSKSNAKELQQLYDRIVEIEEV